MKLVQIQHGGLSEACPLIKGQVAFEINQVYLSFIITQTIAFFLLGSERKI